MHKSHEKRFVGTTTPNETGRAENDDGERGDLIARKRPKNRWRVAEKFVEKAKDAVGYQVNVKALSGCNFYPAQH